MRTEIGPWVIDYDESKGDSTDNITLQRNDEVTYRVKVSARRSAVHKFATLTTETFHNGGGSNAFAHINFGE